MLLAAGAGDKYELREPLLALRKAVCEALGQPDQAAQTLHEAAVAARQAGHLTHAMAAAHELTNLHAAASRSHPSPPGRLPQLCVMLPRPGLLAAVDALLKSGSPVLLLGSSLHAESVTHWWWSYVFLSL